MSGRMDQQRMCVETRRALGKACRLDEILSVREVAEALRQYAKSTRAGLEFQNCVAKIKLLAERKAGALLAGMHLRGGNHKSLSQNLAKRGGQACFAVKTPKNEPVPDGLGIGSKSMSEPDNAALRALGISRQQSARWQLEASVPQELFERFVRETGLLGEELTSKGLLRLARELRAEGDGTAGKAARHVDAWGCRSIFGEVRSELRLMASNGERYACVYVAPRWPEDESCCRSGRKRGALCGIEESLRALPVGEVAAEEAHLHLWTVPEALPCAVKVLKAWGFRYASCLVCTGRSGGSGLYWGRETGLVLLGVRGWLPFQDNSMPGCAESMDALDGNPSGWLRGLVERASPGPYLDLFGTEKAAGWLPTGR